jgi:hypothetical protein
MFPFSTLPAAPATDELLAQQRQKHSEDGRASVISGLVADLARAASGGLQQPHGGSSNTSSRTPSTNGAAAPSAPPPAGPSPVFALGKEATLGLPSSQRARNLPPLPDTSAAGESPSRASS